VKKLQFKIDCINAINTVKNSSDWWKVANAYKNKRSHTPTSLTVIDFATHFQVLLCSERDQLSISWCITGAIDPFLDSPFELYEILIVLSKCKYGKAPGLDRVCYEHYKNAPLSFIVEVLRLLNFIFLSEEIPTSFRRAIIVPLFKKGDANDASNYRGLSLLDTICKIFTGLILNRILTWIEMNNVLNEYQAGFRKNYSTNNNVFSLCSIVQLNFKKKKKTFAFFVDLKCAFDKLPRNSLFYKLSNLGLSRKIIIILMLLYESTSSQVWDGRALSDPFDIDQGVKQGCLLSPVLFSLYLNDLHDSLPGGASVGGLNVKVLMYADDLVLLSNCPMELQRMIDALALYCDTWGLQVNLDKSNILVFREGPRLSSSLKW